MAALYVIILIVLTVVTAILAMKTNLIRDELSDLERLRTLAFLRNKRNAKSPFSLAKTQMAFWTIIILSTFLALYFSSGGIVPELTNVSLILLGISVGTTTIGKVIDDSQKSNLRHQNQPSKGLLVDLLSDEKGVSIHRLQNVIWNVIVAMIYIKYVFSAEKFPGSDVISDQLLMLMGISTGAYLGVKVTENAGKPDTVGINSIPGAITEDEIEDNYKIPQAPQPNALAANRQAPPEGVVNHNQN